MRFKVFKEVPHGVQIGGKLINTTKREPGFYFHVRSTNGKITLPSQAYPTAGHAHRAVAQVWKSFAKALGEVALAHARPVPYTKDSLLPVTRKKRTAAKRAVRSSMAGAKRLKRFAKAGPKKTLQRPMKRAARTEVL